MNYLKNECGGHRIQRIPPTEKRGRVQTSTVTVAVLDSCTTNHFTFKESDVRCEWFSGTGGGGQYRNKHQNSCRLIHIPTGITETAQCRSRKNSYNEALESLKKKLYSQAERSANNEVSFIRKEQVGSGMRGDKIRTYRFRDDIVKDHVTGKSASCEKVLKGNFDLLW